MTEKYIGRISLYFAILLQQWP